MIIGNEHYWNDIESGWILISKEEYEQRMRIKHQVMKSVFGKIKQDNIRRGSIIITSTPIGGDSNEDMRKFWEQNDLNTL